MEIDLHNLLEKIVKENKISTYLEIGTREGCSLRKVIESNPNLTEIVVSDLWGTTYGGSGRRSHGHILKLLSELSFSGKTTFLDGDSKQTIPTLGSEYNNYFDLVLVDGDHSYDGGMADLQNVWNLCKSGGILLFDDITHPAHLYLDECFDVFVNNKKEQISNIEKIRYGNGVGIIYKK